jgi:hypothetical protein
MLLAAGSDIPWAAIAPLIALAVAWVVFCLVQIVRAPAVRLMPKWIWAVLTIASVPIGGAVFLLIGREER